jgi:hypothetical protein
MAETRWYYAIGQAPSGPLTAGELRDRVASGQLSPDTLVCQDPVSGAGLEPGHWTPPFVWWLPPRGF